MFLKVGIAFTAIVLLVIAARLLYKLIDGIDFDQYDNENIVFMDRGDGWVDFYIIPSGKPEEDKKEGGGGDG